MVVVKNVGELLSKARNRGLALSDGASMALVKAIEGLIRDSKLTLQSSANDDNLLAIKHRLMDDGRGGNGLEALLQATTSSTGNPVEEALQFIESGSAQMAF